MPLMLPKWAGRPNDTGGSANIQTLLDSIGSTRGSVLYRGAAGWAVLTPGTSGYALASNGPGADPSYQAASGSGLTQPQVMARGLGV
jgi:hypothetical protein